MGFIGTAREAVESNTALCTATGSACLGSGERLLCGSAVLGSRSGTLVDEAKDQRVVGSREVPRAGGKAELAVEL